METTIHNITSITLGDIGSHVVAEGGRHFYTRRIVVEDEKGSVFTLSLFSDNKKALKAVANIKQKI